MALLFLNLETFENTHLHSWHGSTVCFKCQEVICTIYFVFWKLIDFEYLKIYLFLVSTILTMFTTSSFLVGFYELRLFVKHVFLFLFMCTKVGLQSSLKLQIYLRWKVYCNQTFPCKINFGNSYICRELYAKIFCIIWKLNFFPFLKKLRMKGFKNHLIYSIVSLSNLSDWVIIKSSFTYEGLRLYEISFFSK